MEDVIRVIKKALSSQQTVVIGARCSIQYSGRAESFLELGDRIILIKEDNTLIIHQPTGNAPVNYMKPHAAHVLEQDGPGWWLKSKDQQRKEYMEIYLDWIHFAHALQLDDRHSIVLQGNERDFSDYLYAHPELVEDGFTPVSREEQTAYGFVDVLGVDKEGALLAIECKRFKAGPDAVTQLRRYVEKIAASKGIKTVRGMIAAPDITKNALAMAKDWGFGYLRIEPPNFLVKQKNNQKNMHEFL